MGLRGKILLGTLVIAVVALGALLGATREIMLGGFKDLEHAHMRRAVAATERELMAAAETLENRIYDWAVWDDAWRFMAGEIPDFETVNLPDNAILGMKLNAVVFVSLDGSIKTSRASDMGMTKVIPVPQGLLDHLKPGMPLCSHPTPESSVSGIVQTPGGVVLVAARPIVQSSQQGPIRGTLLFARTSDTGVFKSLAPESGFMVEGFPGGVGGPWGSQEAWAKLSAGATDVVRPMDDGRIEGYGIVCDLSGRPALLLRVEHP